MTESKKIDGIGAFEATTVMYLPNPPMLYDGFESSKPNIARLIEENGNHWRKIFTILAKLGCETDRWQHYRDNQLLLQNERLDFSDSLNAKGRWHLVAGKASWLRLGFNEKMFQAIDEQERSFYRDNILLLPYPDYRQFPNALIAQIRAIMQKS